MIDPLARWAAYGEKPDYAGLLSFAGLPYTEDRDELAGADAVIVGAPMDDLTSDTPGTRLGPRAIRAASCPPGPHLEAGVDPLRGALRVVDFGDAPVLPADPVRSHAAIEETVAVVLAAGAIPIVLGGDHSITEPEVRACAAAQAPVGLIHFDSHTDTASSLFGARLSHGTSMYRLVESGQVEARRYVQIGLRGYWPGKEELAWQRARGITSHLMRDVRERGIRSVIEDAIAQVGAGPVFLSVDVDVLDPAFAPGTGTPEPGGMTSAELLWACREVTTRVPLAGADVVEVLPDRVGSRDITALVAERVVREILTGVALRRGAVGPTIPDAIGAAYEAAI
jgi:agmatinase